MRPLRSGRRLAVLTVVAGLAVLGGCGPRRVGTVGAGAAAGHAEVGIYRGTISDEAAGRSRKFRLLLYAELPDRIHGEVLSPLGRTELIIDGGSGRMAVSVVRERVAFVGRPEPRTLDELVGAPILLEDLVRSLLTDPAADVPAATAYRTLRAEAEGPGLPGLFEVGSGGRGLRLELRRRDRKPRPPGGLGTGAPPAGFEQRPLAELAWDWFDDGSEAAPDADGG